MESWSVVFVISIMAVSSETLEPCKYSLGMESGLISDDQIIHPNGINSQKKNVRMGEFRNCWNGSVIEVNFKRLMTITGIAFNGTSEIKGISIRYTKGVVWNLKESKANATDDSRILNYTKPNEVQHNWFGNDTFTLSRIHLQLPSSPTCNNLQVEFYGCSEVCNSILSKEHHNNSKTITLVHPLRISGVIITLLENQQLDQINITCKLKKEIIATYQVKLHDQTVVTYWFLQQKVCDEVDINKSYAKLYLLGCSSACMEKLDVKESNVVSSGYNHYPSLSNKLNRDPQKPSKSFLNNIDASWQQNFNNSQQPWIRACFPSAVMVSGIAMQAQGRYGYGHIKKYTIQFSYDDSPKFYNYTDMNGSIIEFESGIYSRYTTYVNKFPEAIQAVCIQVTATLCPLPKDEGCALRWDILGCQQFNVDISSKIENITITSTSVSFSWRPIITTVNDFIVTGYGIIIKEKRRNATILNVVTNTTHYVAEGLTPYTKYVLYVNGFNRFNVSTKLAEKEFLTKSSILDRKDLVAPVVSTQNISSTVALKLPHGPSSTSFYVIVVSLGALDTEPDPSELKGFQISNPSVPYITGIFEEYRESFTVGDGRNYSLKTKQRRAVRNVSQYDSMVVMNVPLEEGKTYLISVRAHDESSFYSSPWVKFETPIKKDETIKRNGGKYDSIFLYIIVAAAAVVGVDVVVIVCMIIGIFFFRRRRKNAQVIETFEMTEIKDKQELVVQDHDETTEEEKQTNDEELCNNIPPTQVIINVEYLPIQLEDLFIHWKQLNESKRQRLKEEYKALKRGQLFDCLDGAKPELGLKNRYSNILTYDHSRVKLKDLSTNQCDYINASFIHGYNKHDMYIATQGPSKTTIADFWQMIWEQNTSVIVMITNLLEKNKEKCQQYWPESGLVTHGKFDVRFSMTETYADFVIRNFLIKKQNSDTERTVQQYHYLSWPDHGVPEYPTDLLRFCRKIRKDHSTETLDTPMVVHCSAGVGRTGTYICIDNMLKHAKDTNAVDVFNFVNYMRSRRIHMVQTEDQYYFIYHALYDDFSCGSTEITVSKFPQEVKALSSLDKSQKNGYQRQFEMLISTTPHLSEEDTHHALTDSNKSKNRSSILPRDTYRVILAGSSNENDEDYINAVYVNGYRRKNTYIATEHPLETTVCEFWKMILQKKTTSIIMLNSLSENDKEYKIFFPLTGESIGYRNMNVKAIDEKKVEEININSLEVSCDTSKTSLKTTVYSYNAWPDKSVPDHPHGLIKLLTLVEKAQGQNPDNPVVAMCSDGSGRTGTFIAISILIEQLQMEQAIDVLQTVKKIRISRPEFVDNVKQYEFCYNTIQAYIDGFSTYSNFA